MNLDRGINHLDVPAGIVATNGLARERSAASRYVAMLRAGFRAACRATSRVRRDLVIGGRAVALRFAGPALVEPMSSALAHLESDLPAQRAATVLLWDSASTGVPLPPVQWSMSELDDSGQSRGYRVRGWDSDLVYSLHDQDYGAITVFDADSRTAIYATRDASAIPEYERATPLRAALHWCLSEPGRHLVHAGAVGEPGGGGVLVAGRSGSGKSTLALSCVEAGLGYVGDDYVLIEMDGTPTAHAVHATAKLSPEGVGWLPALAGAIMAQDVMDGGKAVLDMHRVRPAALLPSAPVRAVVLPRVRVGSPTRLRAVSAAEAVRAVAPSTVLQHFGYGVAGMATVAELMRDVPVYAIELGQDMASAVDAVAQLAQGSEP